MTIKEQRPVPNNEANTKGMLLSVITIANSYDSGNFNISVVKLVHVYTLYSVNLTDDFHWNCPSIEGCFF